MNLSMVDDDRRGEAGFDPELLLVLAKAGDGVALGRLLERYRNYMTVLIRIQVGRRLSRKVDAEDLLQEIGLAASIPRRSRGSGGVRSGSSDWTWSRRIESASTPGQPDPTFSGPDQVP